MSFQECCKNCKYSISGRSSSHGWCLLRKIKVHPEIAQFAFCHQWIQKEPSLPILDKGYGNLDKQLDFGKALNTCDT